MAQGAAEDGSDFSGVSASAGPEGDAGLKRAGLVLLWLSIFVFLVAVLGQFASLQVTPWALVWWTQGGESGRMSVVVSDRIGPIPGVQVEVPDRSGRLNATTDSHGACAIAVPQKISDLRVGYIQVVSRTRRPVDTGRGLTVHVFALGSSIHRSAE